MCFKVVIALYTCLPKCVAIQAFPTVACCPARTFTGCKYIFATSRYLDT